MGYRSDVVITIGFKTQEELDTFLAPRLLSAPLREWRDCFSRVVDEPNCVMIQLEGVKWYDDYPDVQAMKDLCNESVKCGGAYTFLRIGALEGDVDVEHNYANSVLYATVDQRTWVEKSIRTPSIQKLTFRE